MKRKSFLLFVALVAATLLNNVPVCAADFVTDAIYVKNADVEQCFRFTVKPTVTYSMNEVSVFVNGVCELTLPIGPDVIIRLGAYKKDTDIDEIFVMNPDQNDNKVGKYLYRGQVIIVESDKTYNALGTFR
ncbi:MAG: hypothetical protein MJZ64_04465 [Paludibacteraceae bacterium]|nr:hypothetical protein [Paludibacteraceae bacterium]